MFQKKTGLVVAMILSLLGAGAVWSVYSLRPGFVEYSQNRESYPINRKNNSESGENWKAITDFFHTLGGIVVATTSVLSILLIIALYRWRKEYNLRRKAEEEVLLAKMQRLKNQLNPHFLFNALNSLYALIDTDRTMAKKFVLELSKVYRYVVEKRNESLGMIKEEWEFTRHYYFLQKIRFGDQLDLQAEQGIAEHEGRIPVMSLQLLVENAIKHNEITRQYPLVIRIYWKDRMLVIENSYRPRMDVSDESMGIGLINIQEVYRHYSDLQFTYKIEGEYFICYLPIID